MLPVTFCLPSLTLRLHKLSTEATTLDILNRFNFWDAVPLGGSASYAEIATATKLPEAFVRRFLRLGMTMYLFREESPGSGRIVHTAASAYVARDRHMQSWTGHVFEETRPASTVVGDALHKWFVGHSKPSEELEHAPWALASFNGKVVSEPLFTFLKHDESQGKPKGYRATRFAEAMNVLTSAVTVEAYVESFDWESLGEATVVDVCCMAIYSTETFLTYLPGGRLKWTHQRNGRQKASATEVHRTGPGRGARGLR